MQIRAVSALRAR